MALEKDIKQSLRNIGKTVSNKHAIFFRSEEKYSRKGKKMEGYIVYIVEFPSVVTLLLR